MVIIDGVTYNIIVYSDRHEVLIPVGGWPEVPRIGNPPLRKAMLKAKVPKICQCRQTNRLDAHHVEPVKYLKSKKGYPYQDPKGNHSATNGQWLCRKCHNKIHRNK